MMEQVIRTNPARSEYAYPPTVTRNPGLMGFVHGPLSECMAAAYPGIAGLRYVEDMTETLPDALMSITSPALPMQRLTRTLLP